MRFVETSIFTKQVKELLTNEEYRGLQLALLLRPEQGAVIPNSGGLRKIRWGAKSSGKRGGIRAIYYLHHEDVAFYMLFAYPKSMKDDLTARQLRVLRQIVKEEFK